MFSLVSCSAECMHASISSELTTLYILYITCVCARMRAPFEQSCTLFLSHPHISWPFQWESLCTVTFLTVSNYLDEESYKKSLTNWSRNWVLPTLLSDLSNISVHGQYHPFVCELTAIPAVCTMYILCKPVQLSILSIIITIMGGSRTNLFFLETF